MPQLCTYLYPTGSRAREHTSSIAVDHLPPQRYTFLHPKGSRAHVRISSIPIDHLLLQTDK